uniref:RBR-type E3 ubiquitin transferase n=1 Tax=Xiphophorus couchianus TaxID=32473 RepID=A0A3B5M8C5_9TELE
MEEVRQRAQSLLSSSGLAQDVKAEVLTLASISLPVSEKYRHLTAEEMLKENTAGRNNALSILEKYGCNLTSPTRPRYWRSVKHNNPVFRTTVDAIKQGGRRVLFLYGYTNQQIDGLSFPDEVTEPDCDVVAAVTLEVMTLRTEVDMLLKGVHPHPECFKDIIPGLTLQNCSICGISSVSIQCSTCIQRLCLNCDRLFHSHPPSLSTWECAHCTTVNEMRAVLCTTCDRPRLATPWQCKSCTVVNQGSSILCEVCERPRLATRPPQPDLGTKPQPRPRVNLDLKRQKTMREDGLVLIHQIREAEKRGVSPEEVYAALSMCGGSSINPCDWLTSELPHLLDEICAMAASVQLTCRPGNGGSALLMERDGPEQNAAPGGVKLSRAEAKLAWLAAGGNKDKAVRQLLRDRQVKMRELHSLGFQDMSQCEEALRQSGGDIKGALSLLQRPLMEPFHQRIWLDQPEPPINPKHPDKQCRRLLALYDLPSWGRCELALSLLQEPDVNYSLEDVVQAVKESQDREFIRRLLNTECPVCLSIFPRSKMQSLTSCQCSVCHECFRQHFTIAVRDKHIRDMVCPACSEPDINDPEQLDSYFSTLDIQSCGVMEQKDEGGQPADSPCGLQTQPGQAGLCM